MKLELEKILPKSNEISFSWLINPKLNDFYFWHFHPEIELVYIRADQGTRHVGNHISNFYGSDLVLIGSNIPHLNFDYGIKTEYTKTVLHIASSFLNHAINLDPELASISELFQKMKFGIGFGKEIQKQVVEIFENAHLLNNLEQYFTVLKILKMLSVTTDYELLNQTMPDLNNQKKNKERIQKIYDFVDENFQRKIDLSEIAEIANLNEAAFCRYFKKTTKLTFTEFLNYYRITQAKRLLLENHSVTESCFMVGYESLSYFNRIFNKIVGQNPKYYKSKFSTSAGL